MSRLALYGRQYVVFDAKNRQHRQWFADFNTTGAWGRCPVRFVVNDDHGDLVTMIQRSLVAHYVQSEFERPKKVAQKGKKTVDIKPKR